ncbi:MAG: hypothetical protein ACRD22_01170 [Terriglobia bacterium]
MSRWADHLDKALDDALASYGKTPDTEGLEQRILVRINRRTIRARRTRLLAATIGTSVIAAGCLCWWVTPKAAVQTQEASKTALVLKPPEPPQEREMALKAEAVPMVPNSRPRSYKPRAEPILPQFPIPSSVGAEERALLLLANFKATHAIEEVSYLDRPITPIRLTSVEIKPIESRNE